MRRSRIGRSPEMPCAHIGRDCPPRRSRIASEDARIAALAYRRWPARRWNSPASPGVMPRWWRVAPAPGSTPASPRGRRPQHRGACRSGPTWPRATARQGPEGDAHCDAAGRDTQAIGRRAEYGIEHRARCVPTAGGRRHHRERIPHGRAAAAEETRPVGLDIRCFAHRFSVNNRQVREPRFPGRNWRAPPPRGQDCAHMAGRIFGLPRTVSKRPDGRGRRPARSDQFRIGGHRSPRCAAAGVRQIERRRTSASSSAETMHLQVRGQRPVAPDDFRAVLGNATS